MSETKGRSVRSRAASIGPTSTAKSALPRSKAGKGRSRAATIQLTSIAERAPCSFEEKDFGFAFDIDGVIYKSGELCPGAKEAMKFLAKNKIPFVFLTNGGGKTECVRAKDMAENLGVPVTCDQFIQAHTPFKQYAANFEDKVVLVLGGVGDACREVAESAYGYKNVVTSADFVIAAPGVSPFDEMHGDYFKKTARALPETMNASGSQSGVKISAIFIYSSPREWCLDLQIIIDLLLSESGIFGTVSSKNKSPELPNNGYLQDGQPKLYFANPDVTYATKYHLPRICQGTFKLALEGMWKGLTGTELIANEHYIQIGKPTQLQFEYGEKSLRAVAKGDLKTVYMVGDGPQSDIAGANNYESPWGSTWKSILVQTGIHQAGTVPEYEPTVEVGNVLDAVTWALRQEGIECEVVG
ncbi:related to cat eye syndrome critical region protein 5 precursor [Rhynchosporium secalis]|uniref:Related to cat eye syndrome critical region protein 5 n=1 Tax=Rhynchosporium secalis TaxID=38038 RepID=A0A1E1MKQ7_RHYSE|nr:related to cat eye syndrome critical region protein 5 precursor [Rhynchosporium secalis]